MPLIEGRVWRLEVKVDAGRSRLWIVQADNFRDAVEQMTLALSSHFNVLNVSIESCVRLDADGLIVPPAITQ